VAVAKFRSSNTALNKTLQRTTGVAYLIASDQTILWANPACCQWAGVDADQIFGTQLVFRSDDLTDPTEDRLKGLCPPPELFGERNSGRSSIEFYAWAKTLDDAHSGDRLASPKAPPTTATKPRWRKMIATQLPENGSEEFSVWVTAVSEDLDQPPRTADAVLTTSVLHQTLAEIRFASSATHRASALLGSSAYANRLRRQTELIAASATDVLIVGPAGSGKQYLARAIFHLADADSKTTMMKNATAKNASEKDSPSQSITSNRELFPVDCTVADDELWDELFRELESRRKTSAVSAKFSGTTESLQGRGVLLLLNVDQLSEAGQTALESLLQQPGNRQRVVATANRSLQGLAEDGTFRCGLANWLSTTKIELPPLNERKEDIPLVAQAFLEQQSRGEGKRTTGFARSAMQLLIEFDWPGNLDQLVATVIATTVDCESHEITSDDFPKKFHDSLAAQRIGGVRTVTIDLDKYLADIERELLARALLQSSGNKAAAAKLLGISRGKLLRRLKFFQLDSDSELTSGLDDDLDSKPDTANETAEDLIDPANFEEVE
jgi:DNA-binding NtrC family response regulator